MFRNGWWLKSGTLVIAGVALTACDDGEPSEQELRELMVDMSSVDPEEGDQPDLGEAADLFDPSSEAAPTSFDPCDIVITRDYEVETDNGASIHVIEKFTPASVFQFPRRGVLMLPGTIVTGEIWNTTIDGDASYNALERAAREGYYAYALTYEGYPGSSQPASGLDVTADRSLEQAGDVVEWIRSKRFIPKVDLFGASLGSSLATALGGTQSPINRHHINRLVLTAHVYKEVTPEFAETFFSPEVLALFLNAPNGYVQTVAPMYGAIVALATPEAQAEAFAQWPDVYAVGPTLEGFVLPVFDGIYGRAPVLQVWGTNDPITPLSDVTTFQSEYGGTVEILQIPGGGHAPQFEPQRDLFFDESFGFLDEGRWSFFLACNPS